MKMRCFLLVLPLVSLCPWQAFAQGHTERGAVLGGVGGALTGAAIGKHNDDTAAGALIGGAVGLLAGSAIGEAKDRDAARQQALYQQQLRQRASRAISSHDVVSMTQNGLSPQLIAAQIRQHGVDRRPEVSDVIALHRQGVDESVITAMQNAPLATASAAPASPSYSPPVVVEHHYVSPRPRYYHHWHHPHRRYHHRRHRHRDSHVHWGISIGH